MNNTLKHCLFKLGASGLLVGSIATTLVGGHAFAADCDPNNSVGTCDMHVTANVAPGTLSFTNDASLTKDTGSPNSLNTFAFNTTVRDLRGTSQGWQLLATSDGMHNTTSTDNVSLTLNDSAVSPAPDAHCVGECDSTLPAASKAVFNSPASAQKFWDLSLSGHAVNATYTLTTNGSFTPNFAGAYTGTVTVDLTNAG